MKTIEIKVYKFEELDKQTQENKFYFRINDVEYNKKNLTIKSNYICTSKYTWYNFLPKNLSEQFLRLGNAYFLLICIIQFIPGVSPFPWFTSVAPLTFILGISAIKEAIEDYKRHLEDDFVNHQHYTQVLPANMSINSGPHSILAADKPFVPVYKPDYHQAIANIKAKIYILV